MWELEWQIKYVLILLYKNERGLYYYLRYLSMFQGCFKFAIREIKVKVKIRICKLREAKMHEIP